MLPVAIHETMQLTPGKLAVAIVNLAGTTKQNLLQDPYTHPVIVGEQISKSVAFPLSFFAIEMLYLVCDATFRPRTRVDPYDYLRSTTIDFGHESYLLISLLSRSLIDTYLINPYPCAWEARSMHFQIPHQLCSDSEAHTVDKNVFGSWVWAPHV
jgi:hypothetical protein